MKMSGNFDKPILIFINPHSGKGKGPQVFQKLLKPALETKKLPFETVFTEFAGHAKDVIKHADLNLFSAIVSVSGDGLVHEIYSGLYERPDWDSACRIPVGLLPGGSGCALNCSLLRELDKKLDGLNNPGLKASADNIANGVNQNEVTPLDLVEIDLENDSKKVISFFGVTIGVIADSDIGSEWMRCIGQIRSYLYVAARIFWPKPYLIKISYLPLDIDRTTGKPIPVGEKEPKLSLPPLSEPVPEDWVTVEEKFHFVYALNLSLLDSVTCLAPDSKVGDGIMWMVLVKNSLSFFKIIGWFMDPSEGPDTSLEGLDLIPIRAFRMEPKYPLDGYLSVDAESYPFGAVQGQILPKKGRLCVSETK